MLIQADARHLPLKDRSVHCVVTSPPYFGLRDYGTGRWEGGDAACDHKGAQWRTVATLNQRRDGTGDGGKSNTHREFFRSQCGKCGATRVDRQIGLEETPEEYVAVLVQVFREVRRVLRDDGTCWLNIGDSYAGSANNGGPHHGALLSGPKNLLGIPWRVALALQADGWHLRSDIIWHAPNKMPESVTDRPTKVTSTCSFWPRASDTFMTGWRLRSRMPRAPWPRSRVIMMA